MLLGRKLSRGAGAAALVACLMIAAQNAHAGAWFADAQSGCQV
jgi:hypothetical protein